MSIPLVFITIITVPLMEYVHMQDVQMEYIHGVYEG